MLTREKLNVVVRTGNWLLREPRNFLLCAAISLGGFIVDWIAFYPGLMSPDTMDQYRQAVANSYNDWHPPVMAALWHLLRNFTDGPQPMLFLQLTMLWTSCFLLMRFFIRRSGWLFLMVPAFMMMPFVQNFIGVIWKDIHLALAWLLAVALMLPHLSAPKKMGASRAVISGILILYGSLVRSNAFPAVLPLAILWWIAVLGKTPENKFRSWLPLLSRGIGFVLFVLLFQVFLHRSVLHAGRTFIEYKLFVHDLTGIYYKTGDLCFPDFIRNHPGFDTVYLRSNYQYSGIDKIWFNNEGRQPFPNVNDSTIKIVRNAWLRAILDHPRVWFGNRANGYANFLRLRDPGTRLETIYPYIHPNEFGFQYQPGALASKIFHVAEHSSNIWFMKPWFWFVMNFVVLGCCFFRVFGHIRIPVTGIALASLLYILFEFVVFPADTELRYFYINSILLSLCMLLLASAVVTLHHPPAPLQQR